MCGIAGIFNPSLNKEAAEPRLRLMLDLIKHRGPDHCGIHSRHGLAMGNQRLKIIDIEGGNQPFYNSDRSIAVVFNGEIYNYREIRQELQKLGFEFKSNSDTEVLVHGFDAWGVELFPRLDGMFAFAVDDQRSNSFFIARDRFGVKPLCYSWKNGNLLFASEIGALRKDPLFSKELDYQALSIYLAQGFIPQPWTIFKDLRKLRAGHFLVIKDGELREIEYHDFDFSPKGRIPNNQLKEQTLDLMTRAVKRQLVSDVPVGMFLSGGFDSTAVLAMARGNTNLSSFTLSFAESDYDENSTAARWAEFLGSEHTRVLLSEAKFIELLGRRLDSLTEPISPWINTGKKFLAQTAVSRGFKCVLSGAGGDEFFCGYPTLNAAKIANIYGKIPQVLRESLIQGIVERLPAGKGPLSLSYKLQAFSRSIDSSMERTFFNFKSLLLPDQYAEFLNPEIVQKLKDVSPYAAYDQYSEKVQSFDPISRLQYLDIKNFLEGSILHLGDLATMSESLEERVPFLDNDLTEFASGLDVHQKFELMTIKPLLKKSMKHYLNSIGGGDLLRDCKKIGFELPGNQWARSGALSDFLAERLSEKRINAVGIFRADSMGKALNEHRLGQRNNERLFQMVLGLNAFAENL